VTPSGHCVDRRALAVRTERHDELDGLGAKSRHDLGHFPGEDLSAQCIGLSSSANVIATGASRRRHTQSTVLPTVDDKRTDRRPDRGADEHRRQPNRWRVRLQWRGARPVAWTGLVELAPVAYGNASPSDRLSVSDGSTTSLAARPTLHKDQ
jgi:hypothetical protein